MKVYVTPLARKDTEGLSWKHGLTAYLKKTYGSKQWRQFYDEKAVSQLDYLRMNANSDLAAEALLEQNYKYYAFLEDLSLRLGKKTSLLKMEFVWFEAEHSQTTSKTQRIAQRSLVFEKAATLYNIGAILVELAQEKCTDDYKESLSYISKAMSCFSYISENFLNSPSADLQAENTTYLSDLSHAEGQEMFLMKLLNTNDPEKKASLISKLAISAANLYEKCLPEAKVSGATNTSNLVTSYGDPKWTTVAHFKVSFYKAVACFYHAVALEQQNTMGEAIAFIKQTEQYLTSATPYKSSLQGYIQLDTFKTMASEKLKQLIKDNDFIYHDSVPQAVELDVIKAMDAIKKPDWAVQIQSITESMVDECNEVFKGIVPMEIYEQDSIYSERKASILRNEMDAVETANWEYSSFMEFTHLPKLLVDLEARYINGTSFSTEDPQTELMRQQLQNWIDMVADSNCKDVEKKMEEVYQKRNEIMSLLNKLPQEQKENSVKLKTALVDASKSDEKLLALIQPHIREVQLLAKPSLLWRSFNAFAPVETNQTSLLDIDDSKTEELLRMLQNVKDISENLKLLKEERIRNLEELKTLVNDDDIKNTLISNNGAAKKKLEEIFEEELEKFRPFSTRIEASIFRQTSLINDIKVELDNIFKVSGFQNISKEDQQKAKQRKEFFDKIQVAVSSFAIFSTDLPKGLSFYDSLLQMTQDLIAAPVDTTPTKDSMPQGIDSRLQGMSLSESNNPPNSTRPAIPLPPLAPRPSQARPEVPGPPPVPPKRLPGQEMPIEQEQDMEQNPTSFYRNTSVFDENLYSKWSNKQ